MEDNGKPIGFCQYYACQDSDESLGGYTKLKGTYSVDYLIGELDYLKKGYRKQILESLIYMIMTHDDAKRIVVEPEPENKASCRLLISRGFDFDQATGIYVREL
ncbi:MAG: GNAT family N-acetyltransferase [Beduini sp.]|uniref:GNAT family N-acetyltransferase n=1 Tax=Beduini sp. TaxID=1922300 RepID=UPI0039A230A9